MEEFRFESLTESGFPGEKENLQQEVNMTEMENWLAQDPVKPAAHPNADAQQSADRQSKTVAPSPVSWAAWRGAIDNTSVCKVQFFPWGTPKWVDEESPVGLLASWL